jgi:hypothetical protein
MTLEEIKGRVLAIAEFADDDERAHNMEDSLYCAFITFVSNCDDNRLANMAEEVLKTKDIDFARWCA